MMVEKFRQCLRDYPLTTSHTFGDFLTLIYILLQGVAIVEYVMEHLATALGMDPLEFRIQNMIETSQGHPNPLPGSPFLKTNYDICSFKQFVFEGKN